MAAIQKSDWLRREIELRQLLICKPDDPEVDRLIRYPIKIGGADLSFLPDDNSKAICCYVVLEYLSEEQIDPSILSQSCKVVDLNTPYIPGFLAFREANAVVSMILETKSQKPNATPDYLMIDGNGILHPRKFGLACHIGVLVNIPTIGVAKNFFSLDTGEFTSPLDSRLNHKSRLKSELKKPGDSVPIFHPDEEDVVGIALKSTPNSVRPIYVSIGHDISLLRAKCLVLRTSKHKVPEPTRQADILGREFVRSLPSSN